MTSPGRKCTPIRGARRRTLSYTSTHIFRPVSQWIENASRNVVGFGPTGSWSSGATIFRVSSAPRSNPSRAVFRRPSTVSGTVTPEVAKFLKTDLRALRCLSSIPGAIYTYVPERMNKMREIDSRSVWFFYFFFLCVLLLTEKVFSEK